MSQMLHEMKPSVKWGVSYQFNDFTQNAGHDGCMARISSIHTDKPQPRRHYVIEWAAHRGFSQADICRRTGIDKSSVSRWFTGYTAHIRPENEAKLAAAFDIEIPALYMHPDDQTDWFSEFFRGRDLEELERMKVALEASFPRKLEKTGS